MFQTIRNCLALAVLVAFLSGCVSTQKVALKDAKFESTRAHKTGLIVGRLEERYLTQPHGLFAYLYDETGENRVVSVSTMEPDFPNVAGFTPNDFKSRNATGKYFAIELPPGKYTLKGWAYRYYNGRSQAKSDVPTYEVKAGKATYLGGIEGTALVMSLRVQNTYLDDLKALKAKYDLTNIEVENACDPRASKWWPHTNFSADMKTLRDKMSAVSECD